MATLNISTSNSVLFGQQITITDRSSAVVGTTTFSNVGTATFIVGAPDTYTLSVTYGGNTYTSTVNVTAETTYNVSINTLPDGATVLPTDDVQTWLSCAAISGLSYTTIAEVIADSETYNALLGDSNASAYMARSTTWTTDICADQYAMNLLGQYDTACDALLSDATWASAIANSTYWESVLQPLVPIMTSATTPSGEVINSTPSTGQYASDPYHAFDGTPSVYGGVANANNAYIGYKFPNAVRPIVVYADLQNFSTSPNFTYQISTDNATWVDVQAITQNQTPYYVSLDGEYLYHRIIQKYKNSTYTTAAFNEIQFYGRKSSGEKIHGGNGDTFYRVVSGTNIPVTDPSLLDAGTYTIYSNGLAKDPANLSNDYGKTVRICPNTKEIVVRPDNSLYWWGYNNSSNPVMVCTSANGWSASQSPSMSESGITFNNTSISIASAGSYRHAVATNKKIDYTTAHCIGKCSSTGETWGGVKTKDVSYQSIYNAAPISTTADTTRYSSVNSDGSESYIIASLAYQSTGEFYAFWYE